jgi:hydrogenase nickel incorporation protein HypA/HybF
MIARRFPEYLMHELSIAESILDAVRAELRGYPGARPLRVGLCIGELAAVDIDSLSFCFESIVRGTEWESLTLEAKVCPPTRRCFDCGEDFESIDYNNICPRCSGANTFSTGGDELDFDFLEVETDGASPTQVESVERESADCRGVA